VAPGYPPGVRHRGGIGTGALPLGVPLHPPKLVVNLPDVWLTVMYQGQSKGEILEGGGSSG